MRRPLLAAIVTALAAAPACAQEAPVYASDAGPYRVETVAEGLTFPWGMQFLPDGGILVTEKNPARLRVVRDGGLDPREIAGIPDSEPRGQGGFLDVRLHPGFDSNSLVYMSYSKACTTDDGGEGATTAVARGTLDLEQYQLSDVADVWVADACSGRGQHFGSRLLFDDDGFLFVTVGDRGEMQQAQNPANHQRTINRLNDDGSIPADNPFVGRSGYQPSIWAYGIRSPQGIAIHPDTREIWETEHGPQGGDELNRIEAGSNYGWPVITYGANYGSGSPIGDGLTDAPGLEQPVHYWVPSIATSGLVIYGGDAFPEWRGSAFVGGLAGQQLARVQIAADGSTSAEVLLGEHGARIRDVREGPDGYIYVLTDVGGAQARILRLTPATSEN
jgi:glucose/arabinose dehydrogenase